MGGNSSIRRHLCNLLELREEDSPDKANEYIEMAIGKSEPIVKVSYTLWMASNVVTHTHTQFHMQVLRLICMQSVANNGLRPRLLEYYKRAILNGYGHEHLVTLQRLEQAGLLCPQDSKSFSMLRKSLRLVSDKVDELVCGPSSAQWKAGVWQHWGLIGRVSGYLVDRRGYHCLIAGPWLHHVLVILFIW